METLINPSKGQTCRPSLPLLTCLLAFVLICGLVLACSCGKPDISPEFGSAPRKEAPSELVGEWIYTMDPLGTVPVAVGRSTPAATSGNVFYINANGTGFEVHTLSEPAQPSERVAAGGTFEIDQLSASEFVLKFYPTSGKVYSSSGDHHDLSPDQLYPRTFRNWSCTLGSDARGIFFESGGMKYYKAK